MRWFEVIESKHDLQNPTSVEKIRLLGERLGLHPGSHVLDVGSGRGGPALLLATDFGCRVTCVERSEAFVSAAQDAVQRTGLDPAVDVVHSDGREFSIEPERYDATLCLGASFIWGGLQETVAALQPGVRADGFVVVGEPYWRSWPLPSGFQADEDLDLLTLPDTVARFERAGVELVSMIASSQDDWDRYESLHWHTLEAWLQENASDPDANRFREMGRTERDAYLRWHRDLLGWAIFIGRKRQAG